MGRTFSISGFFDDNSISIIKSILVESNKGLLRGLILELIENSIILKSFPQQSATSAVQEWLVQVLTAICIKVLNGGLKSIQNFKEEN